MRRLPALRLRNPGNHLGRFPLRQGFEPSGDPAMPCGGRRLQAPALPVEIFQGRRRDHGGEVEKRRPALAPIGPAAFPAQD